MIKRRVSHYRPLGHVETRCGLTPPDSTVSVTYDCTADETRVTCKSCVKCIKVSKAILGAAVMLGLLPPPGTKKH